MQTKTLDEILSTLTQNDQGVPLYRRVEERLKSAASLEQFQNGALFPDELTLANRLGVSRGTARAALSRLVQQGLLERKAGVGTRVARPKPRSGISAWRSFSREMAEKGIPVETYSSECRAHPATAVVAQALQLEPRTPVLRLDRVRGWGGVPVLFSSSWLHPRLQLTGAEDYSKPLYDVIESASGIVAEKAREDFTAVAASAVLAKRLGVKPGSPILLRCHAVCEANGRPIEYAEVNYVSSRFTLTLDLRRESLGA
ncbi:MAG: GntR family transcriptional regulator [Opitutae bacterium]|nr:GntR family transcriptional regulator [Opitutae bacterium]